ncbi:MAG: hypothetical protein RL323_814, partial [Pseudomonadota bacterium]
MNPTLVTLQAWSDAGWLRRIDSALASFVHELDPSAGPQVLVGCALLAHMEGRGHTALPLTRLLSSPSDLLGGSGQASEAWATLQSTLPRELGTWVDALRRSPAVRCVPWPETAMPDPDQGQPLVLSGTAAEPLLYLRRYWVYENQLAAALAQRAAQVAEVDTAQARHWLDKLFGSTAAAGGCDWQKVACALALRSSLTVITGGPGTGKTYTAARLLALLLATSADPSQLKVALAAPTGKAAARLRHSIDQSLQDLQQRLGNSLNLQELTQRMGQAKTVHSLLGARADTRQFKFNAHQPLDVDLVIVDETSMVHIEMMAALLQALPLHAKLVLLGDKDQLASVEAGSVLGDLCAPAHGARYSAATRQYIQNVAHELLPDPGEPGAALEQQTVMLRHSQRFGTGIGLLAKAVNQGLAHTPGAPDAHNTGAYDLLLEGTAEASNPEFQNQEFLPQNSPGKVWLAPGKVSPQTVWGLATNGRPLARASYADYLRVIKQGPPQTDPSAQTHAQWVKAVLVNFDRFRVLCAVHEGPWGDKELNRQIQRVLAQAGWLPSAGEWFVGRPVMVTRNDPAQG